MYFGDKSRSSGKSSLYRHEVFGFEKQLLWKTDNCICNLISLNLSLNLNLSLEVYSSTCVLAKHSLLEEGKLTQQPENRGHVEI